MPCDHCLTTHPHIRYVTCSMPTLHMVRARGGRPHGGEGALHDGTSRFLQRTSYRSLLVASAPRFRQATFFSSSSLVCVEHGQRAHPSGPTANMLRGVQG